MCHDFDTQGRSDRLPRRENMVYFNNEKMGAFMDDKNPSVSEQTKHELAAALQKVMAPKPLDKITSTELT